MNFREQVLESLFRAVDEVNLHLGPGHKLDKSIDTNLQGGEGGLDSLGLLSFTVAVEQKIEEDLGKTIVCDWEKMASGDQPALSTIGTLRDYIANTLNGARND